MIEDIVKAWPYAVVYLEADNPDLNHARAAAFVFDTPDGFAFVDPSYIDPYGASHCFHRIRCTLDLTDLEMGVIRFAGKGVWSGRIERYDPDSAAHKRIVGEGLDDFLADLRARRKQGVTLDEERQELRAGPLALDLA